LNLTVEENNFDPSNIIKEEKRKTKKKKRKRRPKSSSSQKSYKYKPYDEL